MPLVSIYLISCEVGTEEPPVVELCPHAICLMSSEECSEVLRVTAGKGKKKTAGSLVAPDVFAIFIIIIIKGWCQISISCG